MNLRWMEPWGQPLRIPVDGRTLEAYARPQGKGRFLCVHAWAAHAGYFLPALAFLSPCLAAVAVSLSGHGASDPPPQPPRLDDWLEELEAVRLYLGWPDMVLVGNSAGGGLCVTYAARWPERVRALVLVDSSPGAKAPSSPPRTRRTVASLYRATRPPMRKELVERLIRRQLAWLGPPWDRQLAAGSLATHPAALEGVARIGYEANLDPLVRSLPMPVWVVRGDRDPLLDPAPDPLLQAPQACLRVLGPAGHFPMVDQPQAFAAILEEVAAQVACCPLPARHQGQSALQELPQGGCRGPQGV